MYTNVCFVRVCTNLYGYVIHLALDCSNITSNDLKINYYDKQAQDYVENISMNGGGSEYVTNRTGHINITLSSCHVAQSIWYYDVHRKPSGIIFYTIKLNENGKERHKTIRRSSKEDSDWAVYMAFCSYLGSTGRTQWVSIKVAQSNFETQLPRPRIGG